MSETALRVIFAIIAIPITLFMVIYGGVTFRIFLTLLLLGGTVEFWLMTRAKGAPILLPAALAGVLLFCARQSQLFADIEEIFFPTLVAVLCLLIAAEVFRADPEGIMARAGGTLLAVFYIGFLGSTLIAVTELPLPLDPKAPLPFRGMALLAFLISVWSSDTLAWFTGRNFGKRLLLPKASPKKTVEGLLGAMAGGALGLLMAVSLLKLRFLPAGAALLLGAVVGLSGQMGDLFESLLKRSCGVKDSSRLFPGHGGILDRIDALIFAAPVYYYTLLWFFI